MTIKEPGLFVFRLAVFTIFLGRAWQHLIWDGPYRTFFGDKELMEGVIFFLTGREWFDYVTDPSTDLFITILTKALGIFYASMSILTLTIQNQKWAKFYYWLASTLLAILGLIYCNGKFFHVAHFVEYSIQFLSPIIFYYFVVGDLDSNRCLSYLKITVAATFVSYGIYAFGIYPLPGVFIDITINILGIRENLAHQVLIVASILDLAVGVLIFIPSLEKYAVSYAVLWGLATALARTWANIEFGYAFWPCLNQYLPETIYRICHGLIPLVIFLNLKK